MSIQYKFRSCVNFDAVEIGNRPSISTGELRSFILRSVFQQQQGFDLLFYDAVSGLEFKGDASQIPSGSSVIVKRVPGGTVPSAVLPKQPVNHAAIKESQNLNRVNGPMNEFDAFGTDFKQDFDQTKFKGNKKDEVAGLRLEYKNLKPSEPNKAIPKGSNQHENDGNILPKFDEHLRLPKSNILAVQIELECSVCGNILQDAVMLPCCQHSFCLKCIHQVLRVKGMCPKCSSKKCGVRDLIPNLSLRRAISQMFDLKNAKKDVSDRESGTDKDVSRVLAVVQRELELPQSPCASEIGSNQVFMKPLYEYEGGRGIFLAPGGYIKDVRNCYMCGSPDHLMRDCPISRSNPMFQSGNGVFNGGMPCNAALYWNGPSLSPFTPYANLYINSAMMPFNASMVPVSRFAVPPYIPSMHGSLPVRGVHMTMSNVGPPCFEHFGPQQRGHKRKHS